MEKKILVPPMQGNGACVASHALLASVDVRVAVNSFVVSWGKHLIATVHKALFTKHTLSYGLRPALHP